jgi:hypothetical protein
MPITPEKSLTKAELIQLELNGKNEALGRYDSMLWHFRSGYAVVLNGVLVLFFKDGLTADKLNIGIFLLVLGLSTLAFMMELNCCFAQLRLVAGYNGLMDQALVLSRGEQPDEKELHKFLHISGEALDLKSESHNRRKAMFHALFFYGFTPFVICAVLIVKSAA